MKKIVAILLLLAGCVEKPQINDQCLRREIFMQCLQAAPKGPDKATFNDWDEVISQCDSTAWRISLRHVNQVKPECRPE